MDLDALRYGNFHQLGEAITDWQNMAKKLKSLATDADRNLKARADKARWAGVNATVTREFIGKTPGVHLDIAGPSMSTREKGYVSKGGTGVGVRTLVEFIRRRTEELSAPAEAN